MLQVRHRIEIIRLW